jgi:hypothetical protein
MDANSFGERAALAVVCAGTLACVLLVALNGLAPLERPLSFALLLLFWGLLFHAVLLLPAFALVAALGRVPRLRRAPRAGLAALALGFLAIAGLANAAAVRALFHLAGPARFRWLAPAAFVAGGLGLLAVAFFERRARLQRALALAAPLLAVLAFWPSPPQASGAVALSGPPSSPPDASRRFLLLGIDGADWRYIEPLLARGELPHLAGLRERGAWGRLKTFIPTKSPVVWTTIATGQRPAAHGVRDFTSLRLRGAHAALRPLRFPSALGYRQLDRVLRQWGVVYESPVLSSSRLVPAFWDLASAHGSPIALYNWWATWPADPILGEAVSERVYYWRSTARGDDREVERLTYPEALYQEIAPLVMPPDAVRYEHAQPFMDVSREEFARMMALPFSGKTVEGEFKYIYSMFETDRRVVLRLVERTRARYGAPADLFALFRIVDLASHASLAHSELVQDHLDARPEDQRRYGRVVSEAYRAVDRALGEILAAFGPANVLVVSDHGFSLETFKDGSRYYHHLKAPDGILVAAGPAFRPGRIDGMTVYDLMPLLAFLKGFPVADDWAGRVPRRIFEPGFLAANPVVRVASYGTRRAPAGSASPERLDQAVIERLRAVGYVN